MKDQELIDHLSKEIEVHVSNIMLFRSKVIFSIFVSPFLLLGYLFVATSQGFRLSSSRIDWVTWLALSIMGSCFIALGVAGGVIEKHVWNQCNKWRELIVRLRNKPETTLEHEDLIFRHKLEKVYAIIFVLLLLSFGSTLLIIYKLGP